MRSMEDEKKLEEKLEREIEKIPIYLDSITRDRDGYLTERQLETLRYTIKLSQILLERYKVVKDENKRLNDILTRLGARSLLEIARIIYENERIDVSYIIEKSGFNRQTVYKTLRKLLRAGLIVKKARGVYSLPKRYRRYKWETYRSLVLTLTSKVKKCQ